MKAPAILLLLGLVLFACSKDDDDNDVCDTSDITYTNTVADIFDSNCALSGCHVDGNEMNAFFSLEGYDKAKAAAGFGRIVGAISHEMGFSPMPRGRNKLDQCTIDQVAAWIDAGSPQ